jgi:integrase
MKKIPAKYSRCGIKIKCLKCTWTISETCRLNNKGINSCEHKEKHRYMFVVHIPNSSKGKISRLAKAENFNDALIELLAFKEELKSQGYHKAEVKVQTLDTSVAGLMKEYLNFISGNGTHAHLGKKLSADHVSYYKMVFLRFCDAIKKAGYNPELLDVKDISDDLVEIFHFYVEKLGIGKTTYSKHFVLMKAFINWVIEKKDYKINNAFLHVSLQFAKRQKNPIIKEEFDKLIEVTTPENGISIDATSGKRRNRYQSWLTTAFKIGLETGLRREEIVMLAWDHVREINHQGKVCFIIDVNNLKNNRRMFGKDTGEFVKPIPVTKGLYDLLISMGYEEKKGTSAYIIEREESLDTKYMLNEISRGFAHFIKLVTDRKIEFKDLRKTYITQLSMRLGKDTKLFTGHGDDQVLRDSYIAEEFIAANLSDFSVFGQENLLKAS